MELWRVSRNGDYCSENTFGAKDLDEGLMAR